MKKVNIPVVGMSCASCAVSVESMIKAQKGVANARVNYANQSVFVDYDPEIIRLNDMKKVINEIGYDLVIEEENPDEIFDQIVNRRFRILKSKLVTAVIFSVPVFVISMFFHSFAIEHAWLLLILSLPVIAWSGSHFYVNAFKQIRHLTTSMDTLIAMGTGAAFLFSLLNTFFPAYLLSHHIHPHIYYESAVIIITLVLLGKFLEERSKSRASFAIKKLAGLRPKQLTVIRNNETMRISTEEVLAGDIVLVKPGEKVAVDGRVIDGETFIDESMLTGEPVPVLKKANDQLFAGTINQDGTVRLIAEKTGNQTVLSQIIELIKEAQASKPPVQRLADKISRVFVPVILVLAIITFLSWYFFSINDSFTMAFLTSITVLIIACPCALGLATPTALVVGIGKAAENGILIRNAEALELASKIDSVVFDKTGTLTNGKPGVVSLQWLQEGDNNTRNVSILHALESRSAHPLASSIEKYLENNFHIETLLVNSIENISGYGIMGEFESRKYYAGSRRLLELKNIPLDIPENSKPGENNNDPVTLVYFATEDHILAVFGLSDTLKESSPGALRKLHNEKIETYLLSGDTEESTAFFAKKTGIRNFRGNMSPMDKIQFIRELQSKGKMVAMAGDGINDAGALTQADLGIAMASGSDIAMESSGVTLLRSNLANISSMITLSRNILKTIRQNFFWAFFYNVISIPVAAGVLYPLTGLLLNPMIAGAAMAVSSVSVVSNSLRLKKVRI